MEPTTSNPFRRQHTPLPLPPPVDHARRSLENEIPGSPLSWVNLSGAGVGAGVGGGVDGGDGAGVVVDAGSLLASLDDDDGNHWREPLPL